MRNVLQFTFRGEVYLVDRQGRINRNDQGFSDTWIFLGGSTHHMKKYPDVSLMQAFSDPKSLHNCYGWDIDHGTVRKWSSRYYNKIPKIQNPFVTYINQ